MNACCKNVYSVFLTSGKFSHPKDGFFLVPVATKAEDGEIIKTFGIKYPLKMSFTSDEDNPPGMKLIILQNKKTE